MATFQKKPVQVEARRARQFGLCDTNHGPAAYMPGDWVITTPSGEQYPCTDAEFRRLYDPVDDRAKVLWGETGVPQ